MLRREERPGAVHMGRSGGKKKMGWCKKRWLKSKMKSWVKQLGMRTHFTSPIIVNTREQEETSGLLMAEESWSRKTKDLSGVKREGTRG